MDAHAVRLVLFFTRGLSLEGWEKLGMLDREAAVYRALSQRGVRVSFVTYGADDARYRERFPEIDIRCNRWRLGKGLYAAAIPWLHRDVLRGCDVIKTNQTDGALAALRAARRFGKPLLARCGYLWSDFVLRKKGPRSRKTRRALRIEQEVFSAAARIAVTTPAMAEEVASRIPEAGPRLSVVPNYVDCEQFRPLQRLPETDLLYVGRFAPEKNLENVLKAVQGLQVTLRVVGGGQQVASWRSRYGELTNVQWLGNRPHAELAAHYNAARLYVIPSRYEGHPKTLIEAMACGAACLGADSPGIRETIRHAETGWLCGTAPGDLRSAVRMLLDRPQLRVQLGASARRFAEQEFSLRRVVDLELENLRRAVSGAAKAA